MRILAISDIESPYFWDFFEKKKLADIDLILSAGDLRPEYLSFLVTMSRAPVLYVHGNHDTQYRRKPPEGCICVDDQVYIHKGIRILGLGGSMNYNGGVYQYEEREMKKRARKQWLPLLRHGGIDILLTHAPARRINDGDDLPHRGFETFCHLLDRYEPRYFIHGHVHKTYGCDFHRYDKYKNTEIINAYEYCIFEYEPVTAEG